MRPSTSLKAILCKYCLSMIDYFFLTVKIIAKVATVNGQVQAGHNFFCTIKNVE